MGEEIRDLGADDLLRIAGAKARLHHRRRIDIDLKLGLASSQNVALEVRRDIDHEGEFSGVHRRNDVPFGDQLRRLEQRRKERMGDPARKLRVVLIDDGDRGIVKLLRIASRLQGHGQRKCINHQSQEHEIAQETAQFLDAQPIDVCGFSHRAAPNVPVCAAAERSIRVKTGTKTMSASRSPREIRKAQSLGESADADRHEIGHGKRAADDLRLRGQGGDRRHHAGKLRRGQHRQDRGSEQRGDLGAA